MNEQIIRFISSQTCASICCTDSEGNPYCFSCFYAFKREEGILCYKTSAASKHELLIAENPSVAGTILPDKLNKLQIKGIQFEGVVLPSGHTLADDASRFFHKQFPIALAMPGEIRVIRINHIKMTDNSLGFGKKITWSRDEILVK